MTAHTTSNPAFESTLRLARTRAPAAGLTIWFGLALLGASYLDLRGPVPAPSAASCASRVEAAQEIVTSAFDR
ncbi:MAG TPA: hypothetical protein VFQ61_26475 [Polyangiaceae bacterium]|nr:hypothetical protein [Polyangiaceae bacterium]